MTNLISKAFDGHNIHIITDQQRHYTVIDSYLQWL